MPSHPHLDSAIACSECDALNFQGATHCEECGASLSGSSPKKHHPAVKARKEAATALRQGYRQIGAVTWLFRLGAGAYAVVTAIAVMALARTDVPLGAGILVVVLSALLTGVMLVGAIQILFQPFWWTLAVAIMATIVTVAHLIGPNPLGLLFLWSAGWAVAFWVAVMPMLRFRRLMDEHMDLYITHHASHRTVRSLAGRSPKERHQRLLNAMYRASRRAWKISAVAAAAILVMSTWGTYSVCAHSRPPELAPAIAAFEEAWNKSSLTAVNEMFVPANRADQAQLLAGVVEGHGWKHGVPRIQDGQRREENDRLWFDYEIEDMTLSARWVLDGAEWRLVQIDLPRPSHEPVVDRFLEAWRNTDIDAIGQMFRADTRREMLDAVQQAQGRRGWQQLPTIRSQSSSINEDDEVVLKLGVPRGEVVVTFAFRTDGRWGVRTITFPKT